MDDDLQNGRANAPEKKTSPSSWTHKKQRQNRR